MARLDPVRRPLVVGLMAKGSDSGWGGTPKEKRVCPGCGVVLTLKSAPLWVAGDQPWHFRCYLDQGKAAA